MMENSKIEWCDSTWNPVTGCFHHCKYCYAVGITKRFSKSKGAVHILNKTFSEELNEEIYENIYILDTPIKVDGKIDPYPYMFKPTLHHYRLNQYKDKKGKIIFVGSMCDLFGNWVPDEWIEDVFEACKAAPQHVYLFLTKNPERYKKLYWNGCLPDNKNMWYGSTITADYTSIYHAKDRNTFLSIEPLQESINLKMPLNFGIKWVIVGAETGNRKGKIIPKHEWIDNIVNDCEDARIPVFLKNNLDSIWGNSLTQQVPDKIKYYFN